MNVFLLVLGISAGICVGIGIIYLFLGFRRHDRDRLFITFGLFSLAYAGAIATAGLAYKSNLLEQYMMIARWGGVFTLLALILLIWFVAEYTKVQPRIYLFGQTAVLVFMMFVAVFRTNFVHTDIFGIVQFSLPWGESITLLDANESVWEIIFFLSQFAIIGYLIYACFRQYRTGKRKDALVLGLGLLFLIFALVFDMLLIDSGTLNFVYLGDYAFVPLAIVMSVYLANQIVKTEEELVLYRQYLEDLVDERTLELKSSNDQLALEITVRENLERELQKSERTARALLNAPQDSALLLDPVGIIMDINEAAADRLGVKAAQVKGTIVYDLFPSDLVELRKEKIEELITTVKQVRWEDERGGRVFDNNLYPILDDNGGVASIAVYATDITGRKAAEVREKAAAASEERRRLARDLHDAVTQTIYSASLIAESLPIIWKRNPDEGHRNLAKLRQLVRGALAEMRTLLFELRPSALESAELGTLISQLSDALTGRTRIPVERELKETGSIPVEVKITMYRVTQEAMNNIAKHSEATRVDLKLQSDPDRVQLSIRDNGRGFDPGAMRDSGLGLGIMRERADEIGASLEVSSAPGEGTQVTVVWQENS
jgi:PAS domain S-box-containing protein